MIAAGTYERGVVRCIDGENVYFEGTLSLSL
jgi:hypothetical protein